MGTIRVKRVDGPAKKKKKKKRKKKGPPNPPKTGGAGKKNKAKAIVKPKPKPKPKPKGKADAPLAARTARVERAHERLTRMLNFDNCPADYESLKFEARYLAGLTSYSFAVMAQRLTRIRDGRLYEADDYEDFRSFVEGELSLALSTVYGYLKVFGEFRELILASGEEVAYSRLLPALPLLRETESERARARIREEAWRIARETSSRQARTAIASLRERYSPPGEPERRETRAERLAREIARFEGALPTRPTRTEAALISELVARLEKLI